MAVVKLSDVIVPEIFSPYTQQKTKELTTLITAGVLVPDEELNAKLKGGGQTFNAPSWNDLADDEENVGSDNDGSPSTPKKIGSVLEVAARMERNNSWSAMSLAGVLAGSDPMQAIGSRVANYWARRLQATFLKVAQGIFAENDGSPSGQGTQGDLTYDISNLPGEQARFSAGAMLGAFLKMGDAQDALGVIFVHSVIMNRMQMLNLIDYIPDSETNTNIPYYMGRRVIMNDNMPTDGEGKFETWIFGAGAFRLGDIQPENATEIERKASSGNGAGQDILHSRVTWCIHPEGYAIQTGSHSNGGEWAAGGPANANLVHAKSWKRAFTERKQIRIARLITKEFEVRGDS